MDSAIQHQSINITDLKDLLYDLVKLLQQEPKLLAMKRLFQCLSQEKNKSGVLFFSLLKVVNSALNSASGSIDLSDLNKLLCDLVDILQTEITGLAMRPVLQCIFNLMEHKNVNLSPSLFEKLISVMIVVFDANCGTELSTDHHKLVANILACVQQQVTKYPSAEGKSLLEQLWSLSLNGEHVHPLAAQILVKLFDDFIRDLGLERCPDLLVVMQQLLLSKEKKERQSAYFLMHKVEEIFDTNNDVARAIKYTKQQWSDYIDVVEHLEEQQLKSNLTSANSKDLTIANVKPEELQDYLREKKRENYNVVATQNAGQSTNFVNYLFAKRTILLFGPEQNDAPENLRDFLDNIVELPQNDFQNAQQLFIFKYYRQYLAKD